MNGTTSYRHTQRSPIVFLLLAIAALSAALAGTLPIQPQAAIALAFVAAIMLLLSAMFGQLTITGDDDGLRLQYGPLRLISKRFPYAEMRSIAASHSRLIDGWGIHFIPFRGWTYNIWGFRCVLLDRENKSSVRLGTDDVEGLLAFLQTRVGGPD